jgi:hypothetical protein
MSVKSDYLTKICWVEYNKIANLSSKITTTSVSLKEVEFIIGWLLYLYVLSSEDRLRDRNYGLWKYEIDEDRTAPFWFLEGRPAQPFSIVTGRWTKRKTF